MPSQICTIGVIKKDREDLGEFQTGRLCLLLARPHKWTDHSIAFYTRKLVLQGKISRSRNWLTVRWNPVSFNLVLQKPHIGINMTWMLALKKIIISFSFGFCLSVYNSLGTKTNWQQKIKYFCIPNPIEDQLGEGWHLTMCDDILVITTEGGVVPQTSSRDQGSC